MKTLHVQKVPRPGILASRLFKLERSGKYEEGLAEIGDIWTDKTALPRVEEFVASDAAEVLLRCGSLYGFFGHTRHLPKAQERSKDLLMDARARFQDIYDIEKIAECETYLALAYWRTGEYNEAETWIGESLLHALPNSNNTRLFAHMVKCLLNLHAKRYAENRENLTALRKYFLATDDNCLKGDFFNHLGLAEKNLENLDPALRYFEMARHYFGKAGHKIYEGTAANNTAQVYKRQRKFALAHDAIDHAARLFKQAKDRTREGFSFDTKALIYLEEGRYPEALAAADMGIAILNRGENSGYTAETWLTKAKAQIFLSEKLSPALFSLLEAVNIVRVSVSEEKAMSFVREFEETLAQKNSSRPRAAHAAISPKESLRLILPPELAHYTDYEGIWINNAHLEAAGLRQGSLAVIVRGAVGKGDLVAVAEKGTGEISCGFYDTEFGMVGLDGVDSEPLLFDAEKITVLGKIIGVCDPAREKDGKMPVEPIKS
jgi:tetratricopeptide (TPR) repeat protein